MDKYLGYKEIITDSDEDWASVYTNPRGNIFDCNVNEYVHIMNEDLSAEDILKFTENGYKRISYKMIDNKEF